MIEVEVKLSLADPEQLKKRLKELEFTQGKYVQENDIYYNSPAHDLFQSDEALRIRSVTDLLTGEKSEVLTYKGAKLDLVSMTRKELETVIADADTMDRILWSLGYTLKYPVKKQRQYYHKNEITVCLDLVENLGAFAEIEILTETEKERLAALEQIGALLTELGCKTEQTTRKSYLFRLYFDPVISSTDNP